MKLTKKHVAFAVLVPLYILFLIYWIQVSPLNSDFANLVLEANEIIRGNIFLKGWNLTGISFVTTDLPFFEIGALFCGINEYAYYIAGGLMIAVLVLLGFLLCEPKKRTLPEVILFFLLCAVPCAWATSVLRAHTGTVCLGFLTIWLMDRERREHKNRNLILAGIFTALGCMGDSIIIIVAVAPILLICAADMISVTKTHDFKSNIRIVSVMVCAALLGKVLDKLYFIIGGANKNDFLSMMRFEQVEDWWMKIGRYCKALLMVMDANFFWEQLFNIRTLRYFVNTLTVIVGFIVVIRCLIRLFTRREEMDFISTVLSIAITIVSVLFILTNIGIDIHAARYFGYIIVAFAVLIVRNWRELSDLFRIEKRWFIILLLLMGLASFSFKAVSVYHFKKEDVQQKRVGELLESNGLEEGYGCFWNASAVTVLSENRVKVRSVKGTKNHDGMYMHNWFCKDEWYSEKVNFVIADENDTYDVTPECVRNTLGEPVKTLEYENLVIMVYDRDLSGELNNGLSDGIMKPAEFYSSDGIELNPDRSYTMNYGTMLYGPYETIEPGEYTLTYYGDNLDQLTVDVFSNTYGAFPMEPVSESEELMVYKVVIPVTVNDIEFREYNRTQEPTVFSRLLIEKTG